MEELDFEIIEEHWTNYNLSDGSRLRSRIVLKKVSVLYSEDGSIKRVETKQDTPLIIWKIPTEFHGEPDTKQYTKDQLTLHIDEELDYEPIGNENVSHYKIKTQNENLKIHLKLQLISVHRTLKFDEKGHPRYFCEALEDLRFNKKL